MTPKKALHKLLLSLFSTMELRRWIDTEPVTAVIRDGLPGTNASSGEVVHSTVELLERRGLITARLFDRLRLERPSRRAEIDRVEAHWGIPPWRASTELRRYISWLRARPDILQLRGVRTGEIQIAMKGAYVPLTLDPLAERNHDRDRSGRHTPAEQVVELDSLFDWLANTGQLHALILGDPGSGKTTALRRSAQTIRERALQTLDGISTSRSRDHGGRQQTALSERNLPVFVRLSEWREADRHATLFDFVSRVLLSASSMCTGQSALDEAAMLALWRHGQLVLLLDGLDEITDSRIRSGFCDFLSAQLRTLSRSFRVLLSSSTAALQGLETSDPLGSFARLSICPLSREGANDLIFRWFMGVASQGLITQPEAEARAAQLSKVLEDPHIADHRRAMYANPFMASLLCATDLRGCTLTANRAEFYDTCLRTLLDRRPKSRMSAEPPMHTEQALVLLHTLAYRLHGSENLLHAEQREHIDQEVLIAEFGDCLEDLDREDIEPQQAFEWLYGHVGVLDELAPGQIGFVYLGFQEYMTAVHIAQLGGDAIRVLASRFADPWWREVILLVGSLPGRSEFAALMNALLEVADVLDRKTWELLRQLVVEGNFTPQPFVRFFAAAGAADSPRAHAVLRLIEDRGHPQLLEAITSLVDQLAADPDARGAAAQYVARHGRLRGSRPYGVAVLAPEGAVRQAQALIRELRQHINLRIWPDDKLSPSLSQIDSKRAREAAETVLLVLTDELPWKERALPWARLRTICRGRHFTALLAPGSQLTELDAPSNMRGPLDMRRGWDIAAIVSHLCALSPQPGPNLPDQDILEEPRTGLRLRRVQAGTFMMGNNNLQGAAPKHRVQLDSFWINETPITNRQYRVFVQDAKHREPQSWRDRRLIDPLQPIVMVSWTDARRFCKWLRGVSGWAFDLPTEAQWEYAARGDDQRPYPWGSEPPTRKHAHFDQSQADRPAVVGSLPRGRGPFGALDQAGNVWEWCKDPWSPNAYRERTAPPAVNDLRQQKFRRSDHHVSRVIRGGSWNGIHTDLCTTTRSWCRSEVRSLDDLGFRVVIRDRR